MSRAARARVEAYLREHRYLTLATVGPDGAPVAHTVGYAVGAGCVYIVTDRASRKAAHMAREPRVGYAVDEDYAEVRAIKGVQMTGVARELTGAMEKARALASILARFPDMATPPPGMDMAVFRIDHGEARWTDNEQGFGYRVVVGY